MTEALHLILQPLKLVMALRSKFMYLLLPVCAQFCYAYGDYPYAKFPAFLPVPIQGVREFPYAYRDQILMYQQSFLESCICAVMAMTMAMAMAMMIMMMAKVVATTTATDDDDDDVGGGRSNSSSKTVTVAGTQQ